LLSLIVFILTRWERRRHLKIILYVDHGTLFSEEIAADSEPDFLVARLVNDGQRGIVIDLESLAFFGKKRKIQHGLDWMGLARIPHPLASGQSCAIGVYLNAFAEMIGENGYSKAIIPLDFKIKDVHGKTYTSKGEYELLLEVNETRRTD